MYIKLWMSTSAVAANVYGDYSDDSIWTGWNLEIYIQKDDESD